MPSEDITYDIPSLVDLSKDDFMELERLLRETIPEEQDDWNGPNHNKKKLSVMPSGSSTGAKLGAKTKRKRQVPNELSKAKGKNTKKGRPTFDVGEPSEASQQPEPKRKEDRVKELLKEKSVAEVLKILRDRVNRRIKNDLMADMASCICLMSLVMENQFSDLFSPIVHSLNKIKRQWPARSDLDDIKKNIKEMEDEVRDKEKLPIQDEMAMEVTDEMTRRLEEIEQKIKSSDEERRKDSAKVNNLEEIFTTERDSVETQREMLSSAFPWLFLGETATNEPAADQVQGSLQTRKRFTVKDMEDLEKILFDKDNFKVKFSDFQGLQDAINAAEGNIPDYLKSIAKKIEDARGEPTIDAYRNILVLVSAAVKEMEDLPVDELDWPTLCKWGATFNLAQRMQFEVKFVETLLKKNMHAYFSYSRLKTG